jgi:hypothetical protein
MKTTSLVVCLLAVAIAAGMVVTAVAQERRIPTPQTAVLAEPRYRIVDVVTGFESLPMHQAFLVDGQAGKVWLWVHVSPDGQRQGVMGWAATNVSGLHEETPAFFGPPAGDQ